MTSEATGAVADADAIRRSIQNGTMSDLTAVVALSELIDTTFASDKDITRFRHTVKTVDHVGQVGPGA